MFGYDVEYVSRLEDEYTSTQEPPRPVEPGRSVPQRVVKHAVAYTLYAMGFWHRQPMGIPMELRTIRSPRPKAAHGPSGQKALDGSNIIIRRIPSSYSDSVS